MEADHVQRDNNMCFLISPMGKPSSATRAFADKVRSFLENEVTGPLGFKLQRSDEINESGMISDDMIGHIIDDDLVITLLDYENVNVYYELAIRHAAGKACFVIMADQEMEKRTSPFDGKDVRILQFPLQDMENYAPGKLSTDLIRFRGKLKSDIDSYFTNGFKIKNPIVRARRDFKLPPQMTATDLVDRVGEKLKQFELTLSDRITRMEASIGELKPAEIMNTLNDVYDKGIATYIEGEQEAFAALAEMTKLAEKELRTSRFAPQAIANTNKDFFRAFCDFGHKKGVVCKRIMCMNEKAKVDDLWQTVSSCCGGSMKLYLTKRDNNFELVVIDEKAAFIHFYGNDRRIKSTLLIRGKPVIREFERIYDQILRDPTYEFEEIDCSLFSNPGKFNTRIEAVLSKFGISENAESASSE